MNSTWESLNDRQRAARGLYDRTPASEWRWQMYGPVEPPSALYTALRSANLVDPGTGATWQALETRKLAQCRTVRDAFGAPLLEVQITSAGRKVVRAANGEQRPKSPAKGQLRERHWAALARLYVAGDAGVLSEEMMYRRGGFDWMRTLLRLRNYKPQPLMEEFHDREVYTLARIRLTAFGRDYCRREWARYKGLYPNAEAPQPAEETHTKSKPG